MKNKTFTEKNRIIILFILLIITLLALFFVDLISGNIHIPFNEIINIFSGHSESNINSEILLNFRLPKAITAILTGASLSVAGLLMQTLFRNPLADPYILGISSGASLGVAVVTLTAGIFSATLASGWFTIFSAIIGATLVLLLVLGVSFKVQNAVSLLIVGIMFGTIAASVVSVLQNFSNPDAIKLFVVWTLGSLNAVTWEYMKILLPIVVFGLCLTIYLQKNLDALLLGENYARTLGISVVRTRFLIILATGLLAGGITAFTGPIAFVGVAIPHLVRGIFCKSTHRILLPASMLCGAILLLVCDIISQLPDYIIPINTISSLFGAPVILWIILRKK